MALFKKKLQTTVSPELSHDLKLRYEMGNLQGVGSRARQEDSFTFVNALDEKMCDELGLMFAVCDGMGGMKDGKLASETAAGSLRDSFNNLDRRGGIGAQLKQAVLNASKKVEDALGGDGGSTVVIGIILHEQLYFASVGDSYFYLFRNGSLYRLNHEQTVLSGLYLENIRSGVTDPKSCREAPEAVALSHFLGMPGLSEVDCSLRPLSLQKGDILLACSDGVGGVLDDEDILEAMVWPVTQDKCSRLEMHIKEKGNPNQDNYTALVVKCL